MQKKILTYTGIILILITITRTVKYLQTTSQFSSYEQGFILGNTVLLLLGIILFFLGIKKTSEK